MTKRLLLLNSPSPQSQLMVYFMSSFLQQYRSLILLSSLCFGGLLLAENSYAGASNALLNCQATQPKLSLVGEIPGDFAEFSLALEANETIKKMDNNTHGIQVIADFKSGVFTLGVNQKDGHNLQLYAYPKTMKISENTNTALSANFDGRIIQAPKPDHEGEITQDAFLFNIKVHCDYRYSI